MTRSIKAACVCILVATLGGCVSKDRQPVYRSGDQVMSKKAGTGTEASPIKGSSGDRPIESAVYGTLALLETAASRKTKDTAAATEEEFASQAHRFRTASATALPEARAPQAAQTAYLFTYFTGDSKSGLQLAWSRDGYTWEKLGSGAGYLKPAVGESKLMRDPCVTRGPDGTYHMVWTTAWDGGTIGHASTRDFLNWSEQRAIPVMAGIEGVRNCWAPEIIHDDARKNFLIFWSSTVEGRFAETAGASENKYNHRIYCTTTTDFKTFAPAQVFYDPGFSVIDATLINFNNRWRLIVKDETVNPPKKHLRIATGEQAAGPFGVPPAPPFTRDWVEGPTAFAGRDGEVLVYFDVYREKHYGALRSLDMETWEDVTGKISLPAGVRHGTIIEVPMAIIDTLRAVELTMSRPPPNVSSMLP